MEEKNDDITHKARLVASALMYNRKALKFDLEIYLFNEDADTVIAYCPSLDISTTGGDFNDAMKNFYERFQLHIEWCVENGTLEKDLENHNFAKCA